MHAGANKIREKVSNAWLIEFWIFLREFTATKKKKKKKKFKIKLTTIIENKCRNYLINRSIELRIVCFCKT